MYVSIWPDIQGEAKLLDEGTESERWILTVINDHPEQGGLGVACGIGQTVELAWEGVAEVIEFRYES